MKPWLFYGSLLGLSILSSPLSADTFDTTKTYIRTQLEVILGDKNHILVNKILWEVEGICQKKVVCDIVSIEVYDAKIPGHIGVNYISKGIISSFPRINKEQLKWVTYKKINIPSVGEIPK